MPRAEDVESRQSGATSQTEATRQRPAGATSTGDGEPLPGAVKTRGDATEAGGGNLHSPQGTVSHCLGPRKGREDGGDATKASGGKLLRRRD